MGHWTEAYVGLRYDKRSLDCAQLVERVLAERFGRQVRLPTDRPESGSARELMGTIEQHLDAYVRRTDAPREGDMVLMRGAGYLDHLGLYTEVGGEARVLHAFIRARQVCLHRLRDLAGVGLEVEGVYRWI